MLLPSISHIARQFKIEGDVLKAQPFGDGLINSTYLVTTNRQKYILQKINRQVFKDIPALARNKVKITEHIRCQHQANSLEFMPTFQGVYYFKDADGEYWQCSKFIEDTFTFSKVSSPHLAYEAGKVIARFQSYLTDLDAQEIVDTIPHFHNTSKRITDLQKSIHQDTFHRKQEVTDLIRIAKQYERLVQDIDRSIQSGIIPTRLVHNDTKISNILFDQNHKAMCMIDLDTCMRGSVLHDFGDALRSGTNTGTEDSPVNVFMSLELFEGYAKGYLSIATTFLEEIELNHLAYAGVLITYEQFIRFLVDYLNGDTYYKIQHPKHNLERAQSQAKLLQSMMA
ncbi:MAG: hypothetical protein CSB02_00685, partial [Bacteroidia bacterium]